MFEIIHVLTRTPRDAEVYGFLSPRSSEVSAPEYNVLAAVS